MINNDTRRLVEDKFINSIRNDVDLRLSDDNESNNALIRLAFADAIMLDGLSSRNTSRVVVWFSLVLGWTLGLLRLFNRKLVLIENIDKESFVNVVFCCNTPNQLKTKDKILNEHSSTKYIFSVRLTFKDIIDNKFFKVGYTLSSLKSFKQAFGRLTQFWALSDSELKKSNLRLFSLVKFGYNLSYINEFLRDFAERFFDTYPVKRAMFTFTGLSENIMIARFNELNVETKLYLHGSVGQSIPYRSLAKVSVTHNNVDAYMLSKVSFSHDYKAIHVLNINSKNFKESNEILYCTNLSVIDYKNISGIEHIINTCNQIVDNMAKELNKKIIIRKHPRENFDSYNDFFSCNFKTYNATNSNNPSFIISHPSSVIFDYIDNYRVYVYLPGITSISDTYSSIEFISSLIGFNDEDSLRKLMALSDIEYRNRIIKALEIFSYNRTIYS